MSQKKVVVLGGGTGTYTVLSGLKRYPLEVTAVVSMADSGGSARKERDEFGLLPVSDVRKALLALSEEDGQEGMLRELFNYRFSQGTGVEGTTFGNLFLVALANILGSQEKAIKEMGRVLRIKGRVLPVTLDETNLVAEYDEGVTVVGEHAIDEPRHDGRLAIRNVYLLPAVKANPQAVAAIKKANFIVVGPGDLFTSLLPTLLVEGATEAVKKSRAGKIFILNLMNKFGQTNGFTASRYLSELGRYLGLAFDHVFVNSAPLPKDALRYYATSESSHPVEDDLDDGSYRVVRGDFLSSKRFIPQEGDKLKRSLLRHDSDKLARALVELVEGKEG
ncbi:uridine diphosphate-N-acetylglucosamine-binding protein YvcK [Candidatus Saccharibacteria bacterium]|nr:uridine diphosphate-N-acetylglucosamine-binding protein YvcK [Candidatus Saccharibacteria bacterium]